MKKILFSYFAALVLLSHTPAFAHGGGGMDSDRCAMLIDDFKVHFSAYEPETVGNEPMCHELPMTGNAVLVFDLEGEELRQHKIAVQLLDPAGKVIAERPAEKYPRGVINLFPTLETGIYKVRVTLYDGDHQHDHEMELHVGKGLHTKAWIISGISCAIFIGSIFWYEERKRKMMPAA
ncbi:hypothetical protein [Candidatus Nitrosacidococcus sp. I8]|uniref:hypothetical protein n=1 Tax=Candidatus Nitrosacidococcus sp. I8 TaxID=2942908 RepID=UPI002226CE7E|nr:hypothetical protein [Candidatus Nitrosacidococcus sp. I8]CAH9019085.1 hypothetical protein NURINAE_01321 [Candidatus Nitrosacidococcus sp. I8]